MSSQPPVKHRPNEFGSTGNSPAAPLPPPPGNKAANYIVGCFGISLLGFVVLLGIAAFLIQRTTVGGRKKIEKARPDVGQSGSLPAELRSVISGADSSNPEDLAVRIRAWEKVDQQKLDALLKLLNEEDAEAIDLERLVEEMSRIAGWAVLPFTESLWVKNLDGAIMAPELTGGVKCVDVRWISETEARAILVAPNYDIQSLVIAYLCEKDGELRVYDWRETLEPMSEVEYWAHYAIIDEPECYEYANLVAKLDEVFYDEGIEDSERAARLYATYSSSRVPSRWRAMAQNVTSTYLHFAEDAKPLLKELSSKMNLAAFAGAYLWRARACLEDDPERAFQLSMKAMDVVGWHPAATDIVVQTLREFDGDVQRAGPRIARSLQFESLRSPHLVVNAKASVVNSVVESLFERCSPDFASDCVVNLIAENYASETALANLETALASVPANDFLAAHIRYRRAKQSGQEDIQFAALTKIVENELPAESKDSLLEEFLGLAGGTGQLATAIAKLKNPGLYEDEEVEDVLAKAIVSLDPDLDWQVDVALEHLTDTSTTAKAARAILFEKLGQPEKAFAVLLDMWPDREAEMTDVDNFYYLDYSNAVVELLCRLAIELDKEDEFIECCTDKSIAAAALANARFASGDIKGLRHFLSEVECEVAFQPYYEAYCRLLLAPEKAAQEVASALAWIEQNVGEDEDWPELDFPYATAPLYGEAWELRYALVNAAVDAGVMPKVWDALSHATQLKVASDDLTSLFSNISDRQQVVELVRRVAKVDGEAANQLKYELESRIHVLDASHREAAKAKIAELEATEYLFSAAENELIMFLADIGRIDLASEMLAELKADSRSEDFNDWKRLSDALQQGDGNAIRENPMLAQLDWTTSLPMIEILSQSDALATASKESYLSSARIEVPSLLINLSGDWESLESDVVERLDDWERVGSTKRFPEALAVWTSKDDAGRWIAGVYQGIPPGVSRDALPTSVGASSNYLMICNFPDPSSARKDLAVHSFAVSNFANWDAVASVYTIASAVAWPVEGWQLAMERYVERGKLDIRWINYANGWRVNCLNYSLGKSGDEEVSRFNFGGIVEEISREPVSLQADESGPDASEMYTAQPTHKLLQPSIACPTLKAGVYVR